MTEVPQYNIHAPELFDDVVLVGVPNDSGDWLHGILSHSQELWTAPGHPYVLKRLQYGERQDQVALFERLGDGIDFATFVLPSTENDLTAFAYVSEEQIEIHVPEVSLFTGSWDSDSVSQMVLLEWLANLSEGLAFCWTRIDWSGGSIKINERGLDPAMRVYRAAAKQRMEIESIDPAPGTS